MNLNIPKDDVRVSPGEVADCIAEITREQMEPRERFISMVDGLESLSDQDRVVVIDYLKQDPTINQLVGSDPDQYYERLKTGKENVSNEGSILVAAAFALAGYFLHKYRDTFFALRRTLTNAERPDDSWLEENTTSRLVLKYDAFKENNTLISNGYTAMKSLLSKKDPQEADFKKVADALKLNVSEKRNSDRFVKAGILGVLAGIGVSLAGLVLVSPIGALLLTSGYISAASIVLTASSYTASLMSWFVTFRVGSNVINSKKISFSSCGWTSKTVGWARKECLARIKDMDDMTSLLKNQSEMEKEKQKALKNLIDILAEGVKGLCISTARILR